MPDEIRLREATLLALLELQEAVDQDDAEAAQQCREKRLLLTLELFSADRKRNEALQQVWEISGRWVRHVDDAEPGPRGAQARDPTFRTLEARCWSSPLWLTWKRTDGAMLVDATARLDEELEADGVIRAG